MPTAQASSTNKYGVSENVSIIVRPQNPYEAYATLQSVLSKMPFYIKNGYTVALPEDEEIKNIATDPSRLQTVSPEALGSRFINDIYRLSDFSLSLAKISSEITEIKNIMPILGKMHSCWNFKIFPEYTILLTLYGPGGNYNAETGTILIRASADGKFQFPILQNIIHEMTHLGIEENIIKKYTLSHLEKESLVAMMCQINFGDLFVKTRDTDILNNPFNKLLTNESINNVPKMVEDYVLKNPRTGDKLNLSI